MPGPAPPKRLAALNEYLHRMDVDGEPRDGESIEHQQMYRPQTVHFCIVYSSAVFNFQLVLRGYTCILPYRTLSNSWEKLIQFESSASVMANLPVFFGHLEESIKLDCKTG
jgi:hypothetical protein